MTMYPRIKVLQPEPFDLVDQRVQVAGVGSGFEATIGLRVRDGESRQIARTFVNTGGTGVLGNFQAEIDLEDVPTTADGYVEVFDAGGADVPANMVVVPVVFGENLVAGYFGFAVRCRPGRHALRYRPGGLRRREPVPAHLRCQPQPAQRPQPHLPGATAPRAYGKPDLTS